MKLVIITEVWGFIVTCLSGAMDFASGHQVLIAASVAIWGIITQRRISREKNSIDFEISLSNKEKYIEDIKWLFSKDPSELVSLADKDKDNFYKIVNVLNTWEQCARSVHTGMYQERYIYKVYGTSVIGLYRQCHQFIEDRQETNPRYFIQFTVMASDWMCKRYKEDKENKYSDTLKEILAQKREQTFYSDKGGKTKAKHDGHAKEFKKQVKKLKKQLKAA